MPQARPHDRTAYRPAGNHRVCKRLSVADSRQHTDTYRSNNRARHTRRMGGSYILHPIAIFCRKTDKRSAAHVPHGLHQLFRFVVNRLASIMTRIRQIAREIVGEARSTCSTPRNLVSGGSSLCGPIDRKCASQTRHNPPRSLPHSRRGNCILFSILMTEAAVKSCWIAVRAQVTA